MLRELKTLIACLFHFYLCTLKLVSEHQCPDAFQPPSCTERLPGSCRWITVNHGFSHRDTKRTLLFSIKVRACCISFLAIFYTIGHDTWVFVETQRKLSEEKANPMC